MTNKKIWLGMLALALIFGMTVVGCGGDGDDPNGKDPNGGNPNGGNPNSGGGNKDPKSIKITNITKTGEVILYVGYLSKGNDDIIASGTGTIANNEITASLTQYRTTTPWTGNGSFLLVVEVKEMKGGYLENVQYFYTNGKTAQQLGITAADNEGTAFSKLPLYTISSQTSTISFNLFRDINADVGH